MTETGHVSCADNTMPYSRKSMKNVILATQALAAKTSYEELMETLVRESLNISGARRVLLLARYGNRTTLEAEGVFTGDGTAVDIETTVHEDMPPVIPVTGDISFRGMPLPMLMNFLEGNTDMREEMSARETCNNSTETPPRLFIRSRFRKKETIGYFEFSPRHAPSAGDIFTLLHPLFIQGSISIENALTCTRREEMVRKYHELCDISDRILREFEISHYENLQRRMNPHFLFNALNTIHSLINTDTVKARTAIEMLADIFHFITDKSFMSLTPFDDEWGFTGNYLEFEKLRFPDTFSFEMARTGNFESITVPPLTIQPLVENAIKHGLRKKRDSGHIRIDAHKAEHLLFIEITDNGTRLKRKNLFDGTLGNIRDRLKYHFPDADLTLKNRRGGGVTATIKLVLPETKEITP